MLRMLKMVEESVEEIMGNTAKDIEKIIMRLSKSETMKERLNGVIETLQGVILSLGIEKEMIR